MHEISCQVRLLLAEKEMATDDAITKVLAGAQCNSLWQKYTGFQKERPRLFED